MGVTIKDNELELTLNAVKERYPELNMEVIFTYEDMGMPFTIEKFVKEDEKVFLLVVDKRIALMQLKEIIMVGAIRCKEAELFGVPTKEILKDKNENDKREKFVEEEFNAIVESIKVKVEENGSEMIVEDKLKPSKNKLTAKERLKKSKKE